MEVTRNNFRETLPKIQQAISNANFIAIDGEFSGVTNGSYILTNYDSPEERYYKLRHNMADFLLMQYGIVFFQWDASKEQYIAEGFNFYIFPFCSSGSGMKDRIFSCQSSSIDFLTAQGFDFNKVFHSGIPYLRPGEEATVRASLNEKHLQRVQNYKSPRKSLETNNGSTESCSPAGSPTIITDPKTQAFVGGVKKKVEEFLKSSQEMDCLKLEPCNSYLRKILYETLPTMFSEPLALESEVNERTKQRYIVITRAGNEKTIQERKEKAKAKDDSLLQDAIGFSKIIQLLSQSQKLIVGHNIFLDLMFTLQQFVCEPVQTLDEFKSVLRCLFPKLLDTKLMGSMLPFKDILSSTALGEMHARLSNTPFTLPKIVPPEKYCPSESNINMDLNLHEAAYDAYITGVSFLSMLNFLSSFRKQGNSHTMANPSSEIISPYLNKVFLMKSPDIPYLNLTGSDLTPSRSHVFHVQFPPTWKTSDIRLLFGSVGNAINISWINDMQCFVGLYNKSQAKLVKKSLLKPGCNESTEYKIRTYEEYQRDVAGEIYTTPIYRPHHPPVYSKNKVWRPNHNISNATTSTAITSQQHLTPSSSASFTACLAATKILSSTGQTELLKAGHKRTGDEFSCSSSQLGEAELCESRKDDDADEPETKRQKSQDAIETEPAKEFDPMVEKSLASTNIPTLLVDHVVEKDVPMQDAMEDSSGSNHSETNQSTSAFEVPSNWD